MPKLKPKTPVVGTTEWRVQYWDDREWVEIEGSRTFDLREATKQRDRMKESSPDPQWRPRYRVRPVDTEPPLPW